MHLNPEAGVPRTYACALVVASSFAVFAPAAPVPQHVMKQQPVYYFPTRTGTKLEYREPESGSERTLVVTAVADRGGAKVVSLGRASSDGSVSQHATFAVTGTGVFRTERDGRKFDTPESWLLLPAEHDRAWEYPNGDSLSDPRTVVRQRIVGTKDVTVPAGTFRCVGVSSFYNDLSTTCWFAPDVGVVRTECATWTEELKSYTLGKD